jgi:hypothetical protein
MSRSNAAAINRRVNVPTAQNGNNLKPPVANSTNPPQQPPATLTLPQVISVFDNRIMLLEKFMIQAKQVPMTTTASENTVQPTSSENAVQSTSSENAVQPTPVEKNNQEKTIFNNVEHVSINDFNTIIGEFNSRFELFAHEISDLKDIVLKLQSYTMEVNKTLLEEKNKSNSTIVTNNNLANTTEEPVNTNIQPTEIIESNDHIIHNDNIHNDNTSIDLKNLIKQEFLQSN